MNISYNIRMIVLVKDIFSIGDICWDIKKAILVKVIFSSFGLENNIVCQSTEKILF